MPPKLILASTSPYRRELLGRLGLAFEVANPQTNESPLTNEAPEAMALRLSEAKARAVAQTHPEAIIIGSDQVATVDGKVYGKPGSHERAVEQLHALSGKTVNFFTGLCLLNARTGEFEVRGIPTLVTFRELNSEEIENYLRREPAYNCAGSAKSEGLGIALMSSMRGDDPNALVGLPLIALCDMLRKQGVVVL
ncbi:Maf family nucleotide pyrophosphatase [Ferribacterium limneticum]|uniref:Maf family nucleotide pyrophosphatase n=1 Tax=Ferribacterium limneticum TaxID=76259 RepID=UPI001CFB5AE7|nr:Maf family nucleotide pyrophosphatase [Ferribacterium limneticum]UCV30154.1 septum formation inhibitor Maf [Ferribacterium limneticum]UCV34073.1 septum formation inhibitor Maf [Ferribacterium limneticum]